MNLPNSDEMAPVTVEEVRLLEANGGCRSELALQARICAATDAKFRDAWRRLWEFVQTMERKRGQTRLS